MTGVLVAPPRLVAAPVYAGTASWLDQAELLIGAFAYRYLKRTSWQNGAEFIEHANASWPEYNRLYAHPFQWYWTNPKMRAWFAKHAHG